MARKGFVKFFDDLLAKFLSANKPNSGQELALTRAEALIQIKDWQALLAWCRQWTENDPNDAIAWFSLGDAYKRLNRYNDATMALYKSISVDPNNASVWFSLGDAYGRQSRYEDAIEALHKATRINPNHIAAWRNLGSTYNQLKRHKFAIEALNKAILIEPKDALAWYLLGNAYYLSGNITAALAAARELRRLDPPKADKLFTLIETRGGN